MRVAEVRRFEPDASTSTSAVRAMVEELGADLLPDEPNTDARIETYLRMYDAEVCARGFVAMRLERLDEPAAMPQLASLVCRQLQELKASRDTSGRSSSQAAHGNPITASGDLHSVINPPHSAAS